MCVLLSNELGGGGLLRSGSEDLHYDNNDVWHIPSNQHLMTLGLKSGLGNLAH